MCSQTGCKAVHVHSVMQMGTAPMSHATCSRPVLAPRYTIRACSRQTAAAAGSYHSNTSGSLRCGVISLQQTSNNSSRWQCSSHSLTASSSSCSRQMPQNPPQRLIPCAAASGNTAGNGDSSSSSSSSSGSSGLLGALHKWNQDTRKLREQLQSLGLAGVVAYGLFNTLYYTVAFLVVWFTVANVPAGLGAQAAMRKAAEVFALVWAGSQVTKLLRAGGALAFAPVVDKGLELAVEKLRLKSKQQAFALVVAACLALAAAVFGVVVAMHM